MNNVLSDDVTFTASSAFSDVELTRAAADVAQTAVDRQDITIDYDASEQTYTLRFGTSAQTFGPDQADPSSPDGIASYSRTSASGEQFLTLFTVPFISASYATDLDYNQHVAQGYWQINTGDASSQYTRFHAFVIGDNTDPNDVPTTGAAHWLIDVFGALAVPRQELLTVSGSGDFEVDFLAGSYQTRTAVQESEFLSLGGTSGALYLDSAGRLRADGSFGGPLSYTGTVNLEGSLEGAFFGPGAAEVGATFEATNADGATLNGSFTGQRSTFASTSAGIPNVSLLNHLEDQRLFAQGVATTRSVQSTDPDDFASISAIRRDGQLIYTADGFTEIGGAFYYEPDEADRIADPSGNFDRYAFSNDDGDFELALYKVGPANSEVELTYTSFAIQTALTSEMTTTSTIERREDRFFHFGIRTPEYVLRGATGTATYNGVVYGRANDIKGGQADVTGTSVFNLDFGADVYDGQLVLTALSDGVGTTDLGTWDFDGALIGGATVQTEMTSSVTSYGNNMIYPFLYGPNGEEIGASFEATIGSSFADPDIIHVVGVTVGTVED